jgi:DNA-binding response OmpR family regulator
VLLVEEDPLLRRALERHLAEAFEVWAADSVATAIAEIGRQTFDVAIVSLPRPESFGLKLLTSLVEAAPEPGRNCIVVVPPGVKQSTRDRVVGLGAIVLTRPVDFTTIRSICDRLLPGEMVVVPEEALSSADAEEPVETAVEPLATEEPGEGEA